ncbi:complex I NDUFA9 subunit family protein [Denitratisoma oestradiolicum]|uniref:NAD-dependent epimerase/dehydratase domain-containing protein n=1 Tax=Denitratisoma oestradiolicum TaxID=311182 RepID=A0A6S6XRL4_9PROT|nr:complex I NDUFA9 subunit family protein [Denitratisoma oestradiolicum]TWO80875.1 hypothetical protein CBW56_06885 [Denitratisoma oestradiolicum]CAB1367365.1 conserved protein of unknown function [Denitratisoma oestradiolicum]
MKNVLIIGGSGFIGGYLAQRLTRRGYRLRVPTRHRERARHLLVLPTLELLEANVHDPVQLARLMEGQDAVINLVGILHGGNGEPYGRGFARAHVELPQKIAAAATRNGVRRLLHISALNAAADAPSGYLRSKAAGEIALAQAGGDLTLFRPSVVFGDGDAFLTLFASLQALLPLLPLACPRALFQPVWVGDVAEVICASLEREESHGQTYELCGPRVYTLRELVAYAGKLSGHPRPIIGLPDAIARLQGRLMDFIPGAPIRLDNIRSMELPSTCDSACVLPFGMKPTPLEAIAPLYLAKTKPLTEKHQRSRV